MKYLKESQLKISKNLKKDLEELLFKGFLTHNSLYDKKRIVFKNVNQIELRLILENASYTENSKDLFLENINYFAHFLAYAVYRINDKNVLPIRNKIIPNLVKMFSKWNRDIFEKALRPVTSLTKREMSVMEIIKDYVETSESRSNWLTYKNLNLNSINVTGIEGTDQIGYGDIQKMWTAYNRMFDKKDEQDFLWFNTKIIVSCWAPKAVKKWEAMENAIKQKKKQAKLLKTIPEEERWSRPIETEEDLLEEFNNMVIGKKDQHDTFMDELYEKRHMQKMEEKTARRKLSEQVKAQSELHGDGSGTYLPGSKLPEYLKKIYPENKELLYNKIELRDKKTSYQQNLISSINNEEIIDMRGTFVQQKDNIPESQYLAAGVTKTPSDPYGGLDINDPEDRLIIERYNPTGINEELEEIGVIENKEEHKGVSSLGSIGNPELEENLQNKFQPVMDKKEQKTFEKTGDIPKTLIRRGIQIKATDY